MPGSTRRDVWFTAGAVVALFVWAGLVAVLSISNRPTPSGPGAAEHATAITPHWLKSAEPGLAGPMTIPALQERAVPPTFSQLRLSRSTGRGLFTGHGQPGAQVVLLRANRIIASARIDHIGRWHITAPMGTLAGHHSFVVEQHHPDGNDYTVGDSVDLVVPVGFHQTIDFIANAAQGGFQFVAVRAQGEDIGAAASRRFDEILKNPSVEPDVDADRDGKARLAANQQDMLSPAWNWLRDASRSYSEEIVPRIKRGGGFGQSTRGDEPENASTPGPRETARTSPAGNSPQRTAQSERNSPGIVDGITEWFAAARRGYGSEIVPRLSGQVPVVTVARPQEEDERSQRDRNAEELRKAEQERAEALRRRREARERREEAQAEAARLAEEARKAEELRLRNQQEEARKLAAELERKRLDKEARLAEEAARRAEEERLAALRKRDAELAAAKERDEAAEREKAAAEERTRQRIAQRETDDEAAARRRTEAQEEVDRRRQAEEVRLRELEEQRLARLTEQAEDLKRRQAEAAARDRDRALEARRRAEAARLARQEAERRAIPEAAALEKKRAEQLARERAAREEEAREEEERRQRMAKIEQSRQTPLPDRAPLVPRWERDPPDAMRSLGQGRYVWRNTTINLSPVGRQQPIREQPEHKAPPTRYVQRDTTIEMRTTASPAPAPDAAGDRRPFKSREALTRRKSVRRGSRCGRLAGRRISPPGTYVVRRGDSLWAISRRHYRLGRLFRKIHRANRGKIRLARLIYPCQRFYLPPRR